MRTSWTTSSSCGRAALDAGPTADSPARARAGSRSPGWPVTGPASLAARTLDQLAAAVRSRLARIQHRPDLITGFLGQACPTLEPEPP